MLAGNEETPLSSYRLGQTTIQQIYLNVRNITNEHERRLDLKSQYSALDKLVTTRGHNSA